MNNDVSSCHNTPTQKPLSFELEQAIATIAHFGTTQDPHTRDFIIDSGSLKRTKTPPAKLMKTFISCLFSSKKRRQERRRKRSIQKLLSDSVNLLQGISLPQLKRGSQEEQHLADRVISAITQFNDSRQKIDPESLSYKVKAFLYTMAGWSLDTSAVASPIALAAFYQGHRFSSQIAHPTSLKVSALNPAAFIEDSALHQEKELFIMKAATLLVKQGIIQQHELAEVLPVLRSKQPQMELICHDNKTLSILSLSCSLFPGEDVVLTGSFQRTESNAFVRSIPLPDSFHLHIDALQTGFPHALQASGFALSHKLLDARLPHSPPCPKALSELMQARQKLAHAMLPEKALHARTNALYRLKQKIIATHEEELVAQLKQLMIAFTKESTLFDTIPFRKGLFCEIAQWNEQAKTCALTLPLESYEKKILTNEQLPALTSPATGSSYQEKVSARFREALPQLATILFQKKKKDEKTILGRLEYSLLRSCLRQQIAFIDESALRLDDPDLETKLFERMKELLQAEIAEFSNEHYDTPLNKRTDLLLTHYLSALHCSLE